MRDCLRAVAETPIYEKPVVRELVELLAERGRPSVIVSDSGAEPTSNAALN